MIVGVTHEKGGAPRLSRTVTTKVAIGLPPREGSNHPTQLDHFIFLKKGETTVKVDNKTKREIGWVTDPELTKHYGENCREFWVVLLDDDVEKLFRTEYAAYTKRGCWCHGDGVKAERRDLGTPQRPTWGVFQPYSGKCAEDGCPDLDKGMCVPSGDLYFMLADFPKLGTICRLHTGSYQSIRQIYSAIQDIRRVTGGRLMGVRCKMFVHPDRCAYQDGDTRKTTTKYFVGLELSAQDLRELQGKMLEAAKAFQSIRLELGDGKIEIVEDDAERGSELTAEFYPTANNPREGVILDDAEGRKRDELKRLMKLWGLTDAQIEQRLEQYRGRLDELDAKVRAALDQKGVPCSPTSQQSASKPASSVESPKSPASVTTPTAAPAATQECAGDVRPSTASPTVIASSTTVPSTSTPPSPSQASDNIHGLDVTDADVSWMDDAQNKTEQPQPEQKSIADEVTADWLNF